MDIDRFNFWEKLPAILKSICEAQYVAVDLEMSGMQVDKSHLMPVPSKPTLEKAYGDARMAAESFTILQFGFTCINWDPEEETYVTKTFNVPLYPGVIVDKDKNNSSLAFLSDAMNRPIRLSSKSLYFLERNGFNFLDVFHKGVPYMSEEEFTSQEVSGFKSGKRLAEDLLDVADLPTKSIEFRNSVKEKVQLLSGAEARRVKIYSPSGHRLNRLQKRLVYELVQEQFPNLHAVNRNGSTYMDILERDKEASGRSTVQRERDVARQVGARILWDAICGQPFARNIYPELIVGESEARQLQIRTEIKEYERRLRDRSPVLVGHNILMDLCFLHCNFVGSVPESLDEFRAVTRERLPRIVDNKYLFMRGGDEMSPDYSLHQCFTAMERQKLPAVVSSPSHSYSSPVYHQAGYNSYMTAIVFLKKSRQLSQARKGLGYIASEDLGEASPANTNVLEENSEDTMAPANMSGQIPEWEEPFWSKYGNRTRVGPFSLILYIGRMAGEKMR